MVYSDTVEKAKKGELGKEMRTFFRQHSDGAIDAESVTLLCDSCGNLCQGMNLTMYIPLNSQSLQ